MFIEGTTQYPGKINHGFMSSHETTYLVHSTFLVQFQNFWTCLPLYSVLKEFSFGGTHCVCVCCLSFSAASVSPFLKGRTAWECANTVGWTHVHVSALTHFLCPDHAMVTSEGGMLPEFFEASAVFLIRFLLSALSICGYKQHLLVFRWHDENINESCRLHFIILRIKHAELVLAGIVV